ncbi:MAG: efflux RND transporter permease subunit [Planctomycetota bacterium]
MTEDPGTPRPTSEAPEQGGGSGFRALLALAIRRPIGVTMVLLACLLFGVVGYLGLPVTLLPELSYPTVTVRTELPGASPEDLEDRVAEPIREAVSVLPGVQRVTTISKAGQADVILEFAWGTPMIYAVGDVREKVDRVFLPNQASKPLILRYDPSLDPILVLGLGGSLPTMELRRIAEDEIEREIAEIDGVAAVKVKGGDEKEILIAVDPVRISAFDLDIREVAQRVGAENLNSSAGILEEGQTEYLVRALNEFRDLGDIRGLIVARKDGRNIYLEDVAEVSFLPKEKEVVARIDGRPAVLIEVYKEAEANLVELARAIEDRVVGTPEQRAYVAELRRKGQPIDRPPMPDFGGPGQGRPTGAAAAKDGAGVEAKVPGKGAADGGTGEGGDAAKGEGKEAGAKADPASSRSGANRSSGGSSRTSGGRRGGRGGFGSGGMSGGWSRMLEHRRLTAYVNARLPEGAEARVLTNPARYIERSIDEVKESGILGGALAILVIYLFLRRARPTLLISLAIPTSLLVTFAPLKFEGVTLNVMSLGGLALGVGMLVDSSIVVLEAISRRRDQGRSLTQAAFEGVSEVGSAVLASTLTTIAVFLPIVFVEGIAGQLFRDQALAVVWSLVAALLVSLFFLPMLAARGREAPPVQVAVERRPGLVAGLRRGLGTGWGLLLALPLVLLRLVGRLIALVLAPLSTLFDRVYRPLEAMYPRLLERALSMRALVILAALGLGLLAALRFPTLGSEVLPEVHEGEFQALVFLPRDLDVETTDSVVRPLEQRIRALDGVARTYLVSGTARDELKGSEEGPHSARIHITLAGDTDVVAAEERVRGEVRDILATEPRVQGLRFETPTLFEIRTPVSVEIYAHELDRLAEARRQVVAALEAMDSLTDVRSTFGRGNMEVSLRFDRERLARHGLDIGTASQRLAAMVQGEVPTRFTDDDRKIDVRVRLDQKELQSIDDLMRLDLAGRDQAAVLLSAVADVRYLEGPSEIRRLGNRRGAEVMARPKGLDLGRIQGELRDVMAGLALPEGVTWALGGQSEEMDKTEKGMTGALLLAVFLVYVVMAAQFESLVQPLIILFTVPLALIGVVLTLDVLAIPLSVVVFIGVILLAGIVVNNAIVLIDRINQDREAGMPLREAVVQGASTRLRPVLMTTTTTVLGLLPLTGALAGLPLIGSSGEGVELRAPMAIAVISGLVFSTLLTLVVIPVVYSLVAGREERPMTVDELDRRLVAEEGP